MSELGNIAAASFAIVLGGALVHDLAEWFEDWRMRKREALTEAVDRTPSGPVEKGDMA